MIILTAEALGKAEKFLGSQGRPLEQALFARIVHGSSSEWALRELAAFQNNDGGFGHGLEPDLQVQSSTVLATTVALQHLRELHVAADHPMVQGAMRFLLGIYDSAQQAWPFISPAVVDAPRAPWWQYDPDLSRYLANPRAEIVGYLFDYPQLVPAQMRELLLTAVVAYLENLADKLEMHELLCYRRLVETSNLPAEARVRLLELLQPMVLSAVELDPNAWDSYGLQPLQVAPSPQSPFVQLLYESIQLNLDYVIERQQADGSWAPNWSWGEAYPDAWPHAKRAWQSVLTAGNINSLFTYGRTA